MPFLTALLGLIPQVLDRVLPGDSPDDRKIKLELQKQLQDGIQAIDLKQLEINLAEASNVNRKWPTWREMLGYVCVLAVSYHFLLEQIFAFILSACGVTFVMPTFEISGLMTILSAMLGVHFIDSSYNSPLGEQPAPGNSNSTKTVQPTGHLVNDPEAGGLVWRQ